MKTLYHPKTEDIELANVLYALGDQTRLQIVKSMSNKEVSCNEVGLDRLKSTLSYHYKILREAGIIRTRIEGTQRFMSLRRDDLNSRFPGFLDTILVSLGQTSELLTSDK